MMPLGRRLAARHFSVFDKHMRYQLSGWSTVSSTLCNRAFTQNLSPTLLPRLGYRTGSSKFDMPRLTRIYRHLRFCGKQQIRYDDIPSALKENFHFLSVFQQSMKWLLQNYWLPTINPFEAPQITPPELPPLAPHLQEYKSLKKAAIKDASLKSLNKNNVNRILHQIERWVGGAKAAWSLGPGRNAHDEEKLSWALDQLCTELLQRGSIVPMSKKYIISIPRKANTKFRITQETHFTRSEQFTVVF